MDIGIKGVVNLSLLDVREKSDEHTMLVAAVTGSGAGVAGIGHLVRAQGEATVRRFVIREPEPNLLEIIDALSPTCGLACSLDCRKQKCYEHGNNRDYDQKLDERKASSDSNGSS